MTMYGFDDDGDAVVGGSKMGHIGNVLGPGSMSIWGGLLSITLATIMIGADLGLGPLFGYAQAANRGVHLGLWAQANLWIQSIATTGLLYLMMEAYRKRQYIHQKWILWLMLFVNVADSLTDYGGAKWFLTHNADVAQNFGFIPGIPVFSAKNGFAVALGVACFAHELVLGTLLKQRTSEDSTDPLAILGAPTFGERLEKGMVWFSGTIMKFTEMVGKIGAAFMLPVLDICLTPLMSNDPAERAGWFIWSVGIAAGQYQLWRRVREHQGLTKLLGVSKGEERIAIYLLSGLILLDTYLDIRGYNTSVYGDNSLTDIIHNPTQTWLMSVMFLAVLCTTSEAITHGVFPALARSSRNSLKGTSGGGGFAPGPAMGPSMGGGFGGPDMSGSMGFGGGPGSSMPPMTPSSGDGFGGGGPFEGTMGPGGSPNMGAGGPMDGPFGSKPM